MGAATGVAQLYGNQGNNMADLETGAASALASARLSNSQLLGDQAFQTGLQQANFNQQNRMAGVGALGAGGSDISTQINNAARNAGSINMADADAQNRLTYLGVSQINPALQGRADVLAAGQLAGANQAGATGTSLLTGAINAGGISPYIKTLGGLV